MAVNHLAELTALCSQPCCTNLHSDNHRLPLGPCFQRQTVPVCEEPVQTCLLSNPPMSLGSACPEG